MATSIEGAKVIRRTSIKLPDGRFFMMITAALTSELKYTPAAKTKKLTSELGASELMAGLRFINSSKNHF